ncbi:MAG: SAM-dependent methyltransferase [Zoogloeaceae bacterium]|nr:SAM-dependent methyltransferase [Zoogloeaceae bacterium]
MSYGTLFLIPVPLGPGEPEDSLPSPVLDQTRTLVHFVAENAKSARAFLKAAQHPLPLQQIEISELNEHTRENELTALLSPLLEGKNVGLISEAGCPAVADPGANLVALAHRRGIRVVPMVGPSSILLGVMASGLSGQNFAFHGYLPAKEEERRKRLKELESESRKKRQTQIFIETPYRNRQMLETVMATCAVETRLCTATDLSQPGEQVITQSIADWRKQEKPDLDRRPTVFLLLA